MSRWRNKASVIIAGVLARTQGQPKEVIERALRDAYPFGERKWHPYKIWLDEIKVQRGLKPGKDTNSAARDQKKLQEWNEMMATYAGRKS